MTRILAAVALAAVALCLVNRSGHRRVAEPVFWAGDSLDDVDWLEPMRVLIYSTN